MSAAPEWLEPLLTHPLRATILTAVGERSCHLVGGAVRDLWIFRHTGQDWDLITDDPGPAAGRLAAALGGKAIRLGGSRFRLHRVAAGPLQVDLQRPLAPTLEAELRRRDLTINSIALELRHAVLTDPTGGCDDLAARILRQSAPDTFAEDPLRVIRLLRFAGILPGFEIEAQTLTAARAAASGLDNVAPERIREELRKALCVARYPGLGDLLFGLGLYPAVWSSTSDWKAAAEPPWPSMTLLDEAIERVEDLTGAPLDPGDLEAGRHAALLQAAAADPAHPTSRKLAESGWISGTVARRIDRLLDAVPLPADEPSRRRYIHRFGASWRAAAALQLWRANASHRREWERAVDALTRTAAAGEALYAPRPMVDGHELQEALGLRPGRRLGHLLDALVEAQVEGAVSTREEALEWADRWVERARRAELAEGSGEAAER